MVQNHCIFSLKMFHQQQQGGLLSTEESLQSLLVLTVAVMWKQSWSSVRQLIYRSSSTRFKYAMFVAMFIQTNGAATVPWSHSRWKKNLCPFLNQGKCQVQKVHNTKCNNMYCIALIWLTLGVFGARALTSARTYWICRDSYFHSQHWL